LKTTGNNKDNHTGGFHIDVSKTATSARRK